MKRIIDDLTIHQRFAILEELLGDLNDDEKGLVDSYASKKEKDDQLDDEQARIGREIAKRKNDPGYASGTRGKKLI